MEIKKKQFFGLIVFTIFLIALAIKEGLSENIDGDFYIFWSAGLNFLNGNALYSQVGGAKEFLYPPFAPMFFQVLALMPFQIAACVWSFFNLSIWFLIIFLSKQIIEHYYPNYDKSDKILQNLWILTFLLTIRYFWHNVIWCNINELVTLLTFGGILLYLRKKENPALICFIIATSLKVMPGLFLLIIALYSKPKTWLKMIAIGVILVLMILIQRGFEQGTNDFTDYYNNALGPFLGGKTYVEWISLSIPSMFFKLFTAHPNEEFDYHLFNFPFQTVKTIATCLQLLVISLVLKNPVIHFFKSWNDNTTTQIPLKTWCLAYLAMVLVAGVSWEGHHVTLSLVFPAIILMLSQNQEIKMRNTLIIISLCIGFMGKDIVGAWIYNHSMEYSFITFMTLFMFFKLSTITYQPK